MRIQLTVLLVVVTLISSACGFRPRGGLQQLPENRLIFVDYAASSHDDSILNKELRDVLSDRSFTVVASRDDADVLLKLDNEQQSRRIVSVQSTGKVSEFELGHSVDMMVAQRVGDAAPRYEPSQTFNRVSVIREYTYAQDDVLGKENEATILRREMRRELILQIILRTVARLSSSVTSPTIN